MALPTLRYALYLYSGSHWILWSESNDAADMITRGQGLTGVWRVRDRVANKVIAGNEETRVA